jgi:hypothetical protein
MEEHPDASGIHYCRHGDHLCLWALRRGSGLGGTAYPTPQPKQVTAAPAYMALGERRVPLSIEAARFSAVPE